MTGSLTRSITRIDYNMSDTVNKRMWDRFVVRARLTVPQEFPLLSDKILEYARQNPLFQQKNQVRLAQNKEIQVRLIYDIDQLDSLQKIKYFEETRKKLSPLPEDSWSSYRRKMHRRSSFTIIFIHYIPENRQLMQNWNFTMMLLPF